MTTKSLNRLKDNREKIIESLFSMGGRYEGLGIYMEDLNENEFEKECYHFEDLFNQILDYDEEV